MNKVIEKFNTKLVDINMVQVREIKDGPGDDRLINNIHERCLRDYGSVYMLNNIFFSLSSQVLEALICIVWVTMLHCCVVCICNVYNDHYSRILVMLNIRQIRISLAQNCWNLVGFNNKSFYNILIQNIKIVLPSEFMWSMLPMVPFLQDEYDNFFLSQFLIL